VWLSVLLQIDFPNPPLPRSNFSLNIFITIGRAPEDNYLSRMSGTQVQQNFANTGPSPLLNETDSRTSPDAAAVGFMKRVDRMIGNDMENIFLGLILMWACLFLKTDSNQLAVNAIGFTVSRILHTLFFAVGVSIPRTLAFSAGWYFTFSMMFALIRTSNGV
jgi:uncharacterized membrane protein YecN with MAPEG domain